uniref:SAP domain-containing protein n=1 Tax=Electrophorus electricus TaxID=8005 RepID=A0A4W4EI10_ELEEL
LTGSKMAELEDVTLDGKPLHSLRVADLKAALEQRGLAKSGQKNALIKRLKGALMLENLQRTSTPHVGLQPNSQIGEEMSQNSFIKQYLAKQQELLRQRMEREAREASEVDGEIKNARPPPVHQPPVAQRSRRKLQPPQHIPPQPQAAHQPPLQLRQPTPPPSPPPELSFPLPDTPKQSPPDQDEPAAPGEGAAPGLAGISSPLSFQRQESSSSSRSSSPEPPSQRRPGPLSLLVRKMESEGAFSAGQKKEEDDEGEGAMEVGEQEDGRVTSGPGVLVFPRGMNDNSGDTDAAPHQKGPSEQQLNEAEPSAAVLTTAEIGTPELVATEEAEQKKDRRPQKCDEEREPEQRSVEEEKEEESVKTSHSSPVFSCKRGREASPPQASALISHTSPTTSPPAIAKRPRIFSEVPPPECLVFSSKPDQVSTLMSGPCRADVDVSMETEVPSVVPESTTESKGDEEMKPQAEIEKPASPRPAKSVEDAKKTPSVLPPSPPPEDGEAEKAREKARQRQKSSEPHSSPSSQSSSSDSDSESSSSSSPGSSPQAKSTQQKVCDWLVHLWCLGLPLMSAKPEGAAVEAESGGGAGRKRRWGSSTAVTAKKPSISITTESLKSLIPDIKPLQEAVVELHPDEGHFSGDEDAGQQAEHDDDDQGLKIRRTVTQVVPSEGQENGQKEKEDEEDEEEEHAEGDKEKEKPHRKQRSESLTEVTMETQESDPKKVTPNDSVVRRSISQLKVGVSVTIDDPVRTGRQLSPHRGKPSQIIHICNLVRPFTLGQLKELLNRTGAVVEEGFWIDKIKSHCYVTYSSTEEAVATREALHGVKWPSSNPKVLRVDFCEQDELDFHKALLTGEDPRVPPPPGRPTAPAPLLPPSREREAAATTPTPAPAPIRDQWAEREREMERRERTRSEREWDRDKVRDFGRDERDTTRRSRSRDRDRRRKERGKSKERRSEKKDKPEEPPAKLLDDLFRKTKAAPCIYWLPLTEEQAAQRSLERAERMKEREKRRKELQEEEEKKREEERKERARGREKEGGNRERDRERDREREREREREKGREKEGEKKRDSNRGRASDSKTAGGGRRSRSRSNPSRDRRH